MESVTAAIPISLSTSNGSAAKETQQPNATTKGRSGSCEQYDKASEDSASIKTNTTTGSMATANDDEHIIDNSDDDDDASEAPPSTTAVVEEKRRLLKIQPRSYPHLGYRAAQIASKASSAKPPRRTGSYHDLRALSASSSATIM
ncbi:hypothetical protein H4219_004840, partial [Mycoemilia scoparia]